MKLIFNDATEISVQQVEPHGDYLRVLTVGNTPEQLKVLFTDTSRTALMTVQEQCLGARCAGVRSPVAGSNRVRKKW